MEVFSACYDGLFQQLKVATSQATATALMHACSILLFVSDTPDEIVDEFIDYLTSVIASPKPTYIIHCSLFPLVPISWLPRLLIAGLCSSQFKQRI